MTTTPTAFMGPPRRPSSPITTETCSLAAVAGAILPTLVAGLIIQPLIKHQPLPHSWKLLVVGLIVNGAWGLGTALIYRLLSGRR